MSKRKILVLLLFCILASVAAEVDAGFEGRPSVDLRWALGERTRLGLSNEVRFGEGGVTRLKSGLGLRIKTVDFLKIGLGTDYIGDFDRVGKKQGYENHLRVKGDLIFGTKLSNVKLGYRFRYQVKNELGVTKEDGDFPKHDLRHRFSVGYDIPNSKLTPSTSFEFYQHYEEEAKTGVFRYRFTGDLSYEFSKASALELGYLLDSKNEDTPKEVTHALLLAYVHTFGRK